MLNTSNNCLLRLLCLLLTSAALTIFASSILALPDVETIVLKTDDYRGYRGISFKFDVKSVCYEKSQKVRENKVEVLFKRSDKVLVRFLEPKRESGRKILIDEKNMWLSFPSTRNPIRVSPAQRLIGEASNGDVANTDYNYYSQHLVGEETIDGKPVLRITLQEKDKRATYHRIELYVDKTTFKPIKSEHFGNTGKLIKTALYTGFIMQGEREFVNKVVMMNPMSKENYTIMYFDNFRLEEFPDNIFIK